MAGSSQNTPAGNGYGLHFLGSHIFGQNKDTSSYGPPGGTAPFADYNVNNNFVGTAPANAADAQVDAVRVHTAGVNRSFGDSEMKRDVLTVGNTYGQRGAPVVIETIVLKTALNPATDVHFQILPIREMANQELAGYKIETFNMGFHMPEVAAEFVPAHYMNFSTSSFQKKPTRYNHGWRIGLDMALLPEGQRLEEMYAFGAANDFHMLAAITVTAELMSVNDQYADDRIREATGLLSMTEIVDQQRSYQGSTNGGHIIAHPGMFGILNRHKGIEYMLSWARRVMRSKGVNPTHILAVAGALEAEAYEDYRNEYARRGPEGPAILRDGEEGIMKMIRRRMGGLTIAEEMVYEPENSSVDRMCLLVNNAQVGRFQLITNLPYNQYREKMAATAVAARGSGGQSTDDCVPLGGPRLNDLYFLNLSGDAYRDMIAYDDLVMNACCFDAVGRLDIMMYDEISARYKAYAEDILGINVTDEKTFLPDPFLVYDKDGFRIARVIGNMDERHIDLATIRLILDLACNSIASSIGRDTYQKIDRLVRFMDKNYNVVPDTKGDIEAFAVATAWENVVDSSLGGSKQPFEVGGAYGGPLLPRIGPIINSNGLESTRHSAFYSRRDGGTRVLCKVLMMPTSEGPFASRNVNGDFNDPVGRAFAWANPHYVWLPRQFAEGRVFDDTTGQFTSIPTGIRLPPNFVDVDFNAIRLATVPRNNPNGVLFPFFSTFSDMRGIVATMEQSSDAHGWARKKTGGANVLRMVREGVEAADDYARAVKKIFCPEGRNGGGLDRNLFFRKELLAHYQRTGDDDQDENTAFLQNALCGVRGQLGMVEPFFRVGSANNPLSSADQTFRFGADVVVGQVNVNFLAHQVASSRADYTAALEPADSGVSPNATDDVLSVQNYTDSATQLRNSIISGTEASSSSTGSESTRSEFNAYDIVKALKMIQGTDVNRADEARAYAFADDLRDFARNSSGQDLPGTGSEEEKLFFIKTYILWGSVLSQRKDFDSIKALFDRNFELTGPNAEKVKDMLDEATRYTVDRIGDKQIIDFIRSEDSGYLLSMLNAFPVIVNAILTGADTLEDWNIEEFYKAVVRTAQHRLDDRSTAEQISDKDGDAPVFSNPEAVERADRFWDYLNATGGVTSVVGLRLSVSPSYWREYDRKMLELAGDNGDARGSGASMSILRPSHSIERGQFVGAPPVATREEARGWREMYAANYADILKHAGACHGADHSTLLFKVGPAYAGAGCHSSGRGRYKRQYGGTRYGTQSSGSYDDTYGYAYSDGRKRASDVSDDALQAVADSLFDNMNANELPNRHFNNRLRNLGDDCLRLWNRRAPLYALLGAIPSAQLMCNLHANGIPSPISLIVMEPFIDFRMNSMVIAQGGPETGFLGYHLVAQTKGMDSDTRMSTSHVSMWLMGLIKEPKNVLQIPYASFAGLVRGGTMRLARNMRSQAHDVSDREIDWDAEDPMARRADAFVAIGGGSLTQKQLGSAIPLAGATTNPEYRVSGDRVMPQAYVPEIPANTMAYPSAIMMNYKAEFPRLNTRCSEAARAPRSIGDIRQYPPGTTNTRWNGWLHQGLQWQSDPFNLNHYTVLHEGCGVFAGIGPGDGPKLRGEPGVLSAPIGSPGFVVKK